MAPHNARPLFFLNLNGYFINHRYNLNQAVYDSNAKFIYPTVELLCQLVCQIPQSGCMNNDVFFIFIDAHSNVA